MGSPGAEVTTGCDLASVGASELNPGPLQLLLPAGEMSQLFDFFFLCKINNFTCGYKERSEDKR